MTRHGTATPVAPRWWWWIPLFTVVTALSFLMPPTGDDWRRIAYPDRSLQPVLDEVRLIYERRNGRLLSNALSIVLMEPLWFRALLKGVVVTSVALALAHLARLRTGWGVLLCSACLLLVPTVVFREVISWSTGFFYYLPPLLGILLLIGTLSGRGPGDRSARPWSWAPLCLVLGLATTLFIEHVTVAAVGLAVGGLVVTLVLRTRPTPMLYGWVVGTVAGAALMFSSPGMRRGEEDGQEYYSWGLDGLLGTVSFNYAEITRAFVLSGPLLLTVVLATGVVVAVHDLLPSSDRRGAIWRRGAGALVLLAVLAVGGWASFSRVWAKDRLACQIAEQISCDLGFLALDLAALIVLLGVLVHCGMRLVGPGRDRAAWAGLLFAALFMLGPLLVVNPIGPRNVAGPLIMVVGMAAMTGGRLLEDWSAARSRPGAGARVVTADPPAGATPTHPQVGHHLPRLPRPVLLTARIALVLATVVGVTHLTVVLIQNFAVVQERAALMERAVEEGRTSVQLPPFPHPDWVHDVKDGKMNRRWFHERPGDIEVTAHTP